MIDPRLRHWIIIIVTAIWIINFVAGVIPQANYEADQAINLIFMTIVGGLFALGANKRNGTDNKELDDKESKSPEKNGAGNGGTGD